MDSSRDLQSICAKKFINILYLVIQISKISSQNFFYRTKHGLSITTCECRHSMLRPDLAGSMCRWQRERRKMLLRQASESPTVNMGRIQGGRGRTVEPRICYTAHPDTTGGGTGTGTGTGTARSPSPGACVGFRSRSHLVGAI